VRCDLGGLPVTLVDTAGLRDSDDPVEQEGVARARARAAAADLVLWLVAPDDPTPVQPAPGGSTPGLWVGTKSDLADPSAPVDLAVSARTGAGLDALLDHVRAVAEQWLGEGDALLTRERHRRALVRTAEALGRAQTLLTRRADLELAAEEIRLATRAVGEITGRVDVEDVLDRLFSAFCIGK
jgi:tRNA modification GTPase